VEFAKPKIIIIAGPNGAGKTTFAREFLPSEASCPVFINADLIAAGLAPFAPEKAALAAGRLVLELIDQHVSKRESFAFETTLSGRGYLKAIPRWQALGYRVELLFLRIPDVQFAKERVALRVSQGGHAIPDDVIERRFLSGWANFLQHYKTIVDEWSLIDASDSSFKVIDWKEKQ
jgi:predicted ABC-type ATPase